MYVCVCIHKTIVKDRPWQGGEVQAKGSAIISQRNDINPGTEVRIRMEEARGFKIPYFRSRII